MQKGLNCLTQDRQGVGKRQHCQDQDGQARCKGQQCYTQDGQMGQNGHHWQTRDGQAGGKGQASNGQCRQEQGQRDQDPRQGAILAGHGARIGEVQGLSSEG